MEQETTTAYVPMRYILCDPEQYQQLNGLVSAYKGYPDNSGTENYAPETPELNAAGACVFPVTADIQETKILEGLPMVDSYDVAPEIENN